MCDRWLDVTHSGSLPNTEVLDRRTVCDGGFVRDAFIVFIMGDFALIL